MQLHLKGVPKAVNGTMGHTAVNRTQDKLAPVTLLSLNGPVSRAHISEGVRGWDRTRVQKLAHLDESLGPSWTGFHHLRR